jgi:hypothetical protein
MPHLHPMIPSCAGSGTVTSGKDDDFSLLWGNSFAARLSAWPLFEQEELAAGIIAVVFAQKAGEL